MRMLRPIVVGVVLVALAVVLAGARSSAPGVVLASSVVPGTSVPLLRVGAAATPPHRGLASAAFDAGSLRKTERIAPALDELYRIDHLARATTGHGVTAATAHSLTADLAAMAASHQLRLDAGGDVQVWVDAANGTAATRTGLAALGAAVQTVDEQQGIVQAMLPISQLAAASALPSVRDVRLPSYGFAETGSVTTQGDTILNASTLRNSITAYGNGVRVGVISDGWEGAAASQSTGDLPSTLDLTTCNVSPGTTSPTASGAGAEGTAMGEIVHDVAPNAQIIAGYFGGNFTGTAIDFDNAVTCLAQHTDVVVDDIGWFNVGPYDGTSFVSLNTSTALNDASYPIRGYYTAVANQAQNHYEAAWSDSGYYYGNLAGDWWEMQNFAAGGGTTDGGNGFSCGLSGAPYCGDSFELAPGASASVFLEWNDPFNSSTSDYDLLAYNYQTNTFSPMSVNRQGVGFHNPVEMFSVTNSSASPAAYAIIIGNYKDLAPARTFNMFMYCDGCYYFNTGLPAPDQISYLNFNTLAGSVPAESDAGGGVVSVGAISASDSPGYDTIEGYSSRGPTVDGRTKPDITAIDCVAVTADGGFYNPFCGSSAAAPHVAGIAALLLSCDPLLLDGSGYGTPAANRAFLQNALLSSAIDLGAVGVDNTYGHGRVDAMAAAPPGDCVSTSGDGYPDGLKTLLGKTPSVYCALARADVNGDQKVNILDLSAEAQWYNQTIPPAPPRYNQNPTVDSKINILDLSMTAKWYNQTVAAVCT